MMRRNRCQKQAGITLLEIMVALSLGAFMLLGIISLMASVSTTRTELGRSSEQIENGRYAVQILSDDAVLAGYYGPYFKANPTYSNPSPCNDDVPLSALGFTYHATTPTLPLAVAGFVSGATLPACLTNAREDSGGTVDAEVLVVRHVNPQSIVAADAVDGTPYMQIAFCQTQPGFVFSNVAADLTSRGANCLSTNVQPAWSYESRAFYIAKCDDCSGSGDGIPTLKVVEFAGGALSASPLSLVEGVEDMHIKYGMDLDTVPDGEPDCFVSDPTADTAPTSGCTVTTAWSATDITNWANVVALDIRVLIRSLDKYPGWNDTRTYDLGRGSRSGPFNDGYKRKVLKTSIMLQNVAGPRE